MDAGLTLFPTKLRNWLARWRVGISLFGFLSLITYNVAVRQTIPHNPLHLSNPWVIGSLSLVLIGLGIRSWAAGTLNKSRELTTTGPYALSRNPLYLGSFLMMFGFCILCKDLPTLIFVAGPLTFLYFGQVEFEEVRLNRMFPDQWPEYRKSTPRLFPRRLSTKAFSGWTLMEWKRNREYRGLVATLCGLAAVAAWYYARVAMG